MTEEEQKRLEAYEHLRALDNVLITLREHVTQFSRGLAMVTGLVEIAQNALCDDEVEDAQEG